MLISYIKKKSTYRWFLIVLFLTAIIAWISKNINAVNQQSTIIINNQLPSINLAHSLNTYTSDFRVLEFIHITSTSNEQMKSIENELNRMELKIEIALDHYEKLIDSTEERKVFENAKTDWHKYLLVNRNVMNISKDLNIERAKSIMVGDGRKAFDSVSDSFLKLVKYNYSNAEKLSYKGDSLYSRSIQELVIVILFFGVATLTLDNRKKKIAEKKLTETNVQLKKSKDQFKHLALTDSLTGLMNRHALREFLSSINEQKKLKGELFYIDLDHFKYINDTNGHPIGDEVLKIIGERLKNMENDEITVARFGGDEFIMIRQGDFPERNNIKIGERFLNTIERVIEIENKEFYISCSIGIVKFPHNGTDVDELLRKADLAMYRAKELGRARCIQYNASMEQSLKSVFEIRNKLGQAINNNEFKLYLQPKVELTSKRIVGMEALIRWNSKELGWVSPAEFIPVAEKFGFIHKIEHWVLNEAARFLNLFDGKGFKDLKIAVNVSAIEFSRPNFIDEFFSILNESNVNPSKIIVEITESLLIDFEEFNIEKLTILRKEGIEVHLDDFGVGYSSLSYLQNMDIDLVKIDKSFISEITENAKQMTLTQSIIDIAHNLGHKVLAEGVETEEQCKLLETMNCDQIQGYYFAKPMSFDDFCGFYKKNTVS